MRNRRQPDGSLSGEILPPETGRPGSDLHVPGMVTLGELGGTLNILGRLRAWGQAKGFAAASNMLTEFERSIRAKERTLAALEDLSIQEARLSGENFSVLMSIAEREIDVRMQEVDNRLDAERARGRRAKLEADIEETRLKRMLLREQEKLDRTIDGELAEKPEKSKEVPIGQQLDALAEKLTAKQVELDELDEADEAKEIILSQEIAMILVEMEALRVKHAQEF